MFYVVATYAQRPQNDRVGREDAERWLEVRVVESEQDDEAEVAGTVLYSLIKECKVTDGWTDHIARAERLTIKLDGVQAAFKKRTGVAMADGRRLDIE